VSANRSTKIRKGYVFIARRILSSTLWQKRPETRIAALTSIVLANHRPGKWCPDGINDIPINRGEFVRSWDVFSSECNLSLKQTRTATHHLEKSQFLLRQRESNWSHFGVVNYGDYQNRDKYGKERALPDGAVLIARKILSSPLWRLSAQDRVVAITCLLVAKYVPGTWSDGCHEIELVRGQFCASWEQLAQWCNLPSGKVQGSIQRLKSIEFLVQSVNEGCQVFMIPNYDYYQDPSNYGELIQDETGRKQGQTEREAGRDPAGSGQGPGRERAGTRQGAGRDPATNNKGKKEEKGEEGEEGGKGGVPPPFLFDLSSLGGAPPPLPPDEQITEAYFQRFPEKMGKEKVRKQVLQFLRRGGKWEEGLRAVQSHASEDPIWVILDPLLRAKKGWSIDDLVLTDPTKKEKDHAGS